MAETIGIVGAGALGSLLAHQLSHTGHSVLVLSRSGDPETLRPASLLFLCVKAGDTEGAAGAIAGLMPKVPGVCSLQNGWEHMSLLERLLPGAPLIAGATALGAYFDGSGTLRPSMEGVTHLASWGATEARWAEYAATVLTSAGLLAEVSEDPLGILWRKLALYLAVNPVTALANRQNGALLEEPPLYRIASEAALEASRVGIRKGYLPADFDPLTRLPALLAETGGNRSSMAEDLARGRRTEAEAILGSLLRAAREEGLRTPVLESLLALIQVAEAVPPPPPESP